MTGCSSLLRQLCGLLSALVVLCWVGALNPRAQETEAVTPGSVIAVLPTVNLSAKLAPMEELRALLRDQADLRGLQTVHDRALESFMATHRMRYTGGLAPQAAVAMRETTGAQAALITTLHSYDEVDPPTFAMLARLVSTEANPRILWMDGVSLTGDQKPGLLAMGLVRDVDTLRDRAIEQLFDSLIERLRSGEPRRLPPLKAKNKFRPRRFYRTPERAESGVARVKIAVLPFINDSQRRSAGDVVMEQFVRRFFETGRVEVTEPGVVRQALLQNRLIRDEGLSLTQIYVLSAELNVDLIISGDVADYVETAGFGGVPLVGFTSRAIDARRGIVSWMSISNNRGTDGVALFEIGGVRSGHALASQMIRAVVATALDPRGGSTDSIAGTPASSRK